MLALDVLKSSPGFRWTSRTQFFVQCPLHHDKTASLRGTVKEGKLLVHCFSCGAGAKAILPALGLPWASLYENAILDRHELRKLRIEAREREKQAEERERQDLDRIARYCAIADDLNDRDAILALDWTEYEGQETWELLGALLRDYSQLDYEFERLRHPM